MKGVVLAAGKGTRLYPVTKAIAKPLLPLANRMTMEYAFDQFRDCGITDVCIVVGENEPELRAALGNGSRFGLSLGYAKQEQPLGLANAVQCAQRFVGDDSFMLYLGDAIYGQSLAPFVKQFVNAGAANLNLVKWVEDPRRFGVANLEGGRIIKLVEKPQNPESNYAMAGMYVFGPQIWSVLPDLQPSARGEYEITDAIQLLIDQGETVIAGVYEGEWFDTGTLESFLATTRFLTGGEATMPDFTDILGEIGTNVVVGEGAIVRCRRIENSVVLPHAHIDVKEDIEGCLLGGEVRATALKDEIRYGDLA
jgi:glucose-1-phosphate thymidylyltransferase